MTRFSGEQLTDLVKLYAEAAAAHGRATESGDHVQANKQHDVVASIYRELRRRGSDSQAALLSLLSHPDPGVRCWVASHALEYAPKLAEPVLSELSRGSPSFVRFGAELTLERWTKGTLRFP